MAKKMRKTTKIKFLSLVTIALFSTYSLSASVKTMKVSEAIEKKLVNLDGINMLGHYTGKALKLTVKAIKQERDTLKLLLDVGIIMKPDNPSYQPMVLAGGDTMMLAPKKSVEIMAAIFCGNSPRSCPAKNHHYSFFGLGSDSLVRVLEFINQNNLYDYLGQHAVWVITNNHKVNGVYDPARDSISKVLISELCKITGQSQPNYYALFENREVSGTAAYTPKTTKIIAEFDVQLKTATILSVGLFNDKGFYLDKIIDRKLFSAGNHKIIAAFDPLLYSPGTYILNLSDAERTLQDKKVTAN